MRVEKLAAIGEIVSSVAIVVTLGYLAVQTKQTNSALQANSRHAVLEAERDFLDQIVSDPDLFVLVREGPQTIEDRARLSAFLTSFVRSREFLWTQYKLGVIDEQTAESYFAGSMGFFRGPIPTEMWEVIREGLNPEFVDYFGAQLEKANAQPQDGR